MFRFWQLRPREDAEGSGELCVAFVIRDRDRDGVVIGSCALSQISMGAFRAGYLGYDIDAARQGRGLMTEALRSVIEYAFKKRALHRIMANYVPTNERSSRLLRRLGFVVEGYARDYLIVAGAWRDHVLTSLTNPDGDAVDPAWLQLRAVNHQPP
jgi:ribosomal-protein-alanine N-acetyltransferase